MYRCWMMTAVFALIANVALAQGVMRKAGKKMENGEVTGMTQTEVTFQPPNNKPVEKIPANDILFIQWRSSPAEVGLARSDEDGGRWQKALDGYKAALGKVAEGGKDLKIELEWAIVRTTARLAQSDASVAEAAIAGLNGFRKNHSDHYSFYQALRLLGEVNLARGNAAEARAVYAELAKAPWKDYQLAAEIANGKLLHQEGKLDEAAGAYETVIGSATAAEEPQRQEALLGKARVLIAQSKFPEASTLLDEVLQKSAPEETALQAEAYVRQGDCLQAQGKTKEALLAYLHVDVLFESEGNLHAEALYHLTRLWVKDGKADRAGDASSRLEQNYPASEWNKKAKTASGE